MDDKEESDDDEEESDNDEEEEEDEESVDNQEEFVDETPKKIVCEKCNKEFKFSIQKNKHKCEQLKKQFENIRIKQEIFENFQEQQRQIKEEIFENYQDFQNFQEDDNEYELSPGLAAALSVKSSDLPSESPPASPPKTNKLLDVCKKCNLMFGTLQDLKFHEEECQKEPPKQSFKCSDCDLDFKIELLLERHRRNMQENIINCSICSFRSCTSIGMKLHTRKTNHQQQEVNKQLTGNAKKPQVNDAIEPKSDNNGYNEIDRKKFKANVWSHFLFNETSMEIKCKHCITTINVKVSLEMSKSIASRHVRSAHKDKFGPGSEKNNPTKSIDKDVKPEDTSNKVSNIKVDPPAKEISVSSSSPRNKDNGLWKHFNVNKSNQTATCKHCHSTFVSKAPQLLTVHLKFTHQIDDCSNNIPSVDSSQEITTQEENVPKDSSGSDDVALNSKLSIDKVNEEMWNHFDLEESKNTAQCKHCSNVFGCSRPQNLSVHLKKKHQIEVKVYSFMKENNTSSSSTATTQKSTADSDKSEQIPELEQGNGSSSSSKVRPGYFQLNKSGTKAKCKICNTIIMNHNSQDLKSHLKNKHAEILEKDRQKAKSKSDKNSPPPVVNKFSCVINKECPQTFNTDYELEDHVIRDHKDAKLTKEDVNELHLGQYKSESDRLKTYVDWKSSSGLTSKELANAGFVHTGRDDNVQCVFCAGIAGGWEKGDSPMDEHKELFPKCAFVQGLNVRNIPLEKTKMTESARNISDKSTGK